MSLTVVSLAYPIVPIGPDTVGGTEQVVSMLDAALVRAGHRSRRRRRPARWTKPAGARPTPSIATRSGGC
jgi:hypothetical protein